MQDDYRMGKAMNNGYDREEEAPYHWSVELVIGAACFCLALILASIPFWIEKQ
jgi:hypothetical protein